MAGNAPRGTSHFRKRRELPWNFSDKNEVPGREMLSSWHIPGQQSPRTRHV